MIRLVRRAAVLALSLLAAACGDVATSPTNEGLALVDASAAVVPGTCTNLAELNQLAAVLFTPGSSPNINSVKGKLKNLDATVKKGRFAEAEAKAGEIVAFTLKKHNQGGLSGDADDVAAFTNKVLCFAGIDIVVDEPTNSHFILPSDAPQVIRNVEANAGISFDANPVLEPTLVEFAIIPNSYPPGGGPLNTKLDQYPGFLSITKTSETDAPLAKPAVVAVCASGVIPADVRARLRLGHDASNGFEVTPAASGAFLSCPPPQTADAGAAPLWRRLATSLLPTALHAYQEAFGGGVGGTVTEFSPFAPVDPLLQFGGGVGGTVTEFSRSAFSADLFGSAPATLAVDCNVGAAGSPVLDACAPYVTLQTRLGTALGGVPVTWDVIAGGGTVAAKSGGSCGAAGASAVGATSLTGRASACWTLGALVGTNTLRATPSAGGDAPAGVTFVPATFSWSVTSVAGAQAAIVKVSGDGQSAIAGAPLAQPLVVRVTDAFGNPVAGATVTWHTTTDGATLTPMALVSDANGLASASFSPGAGTNSIKVYLSDVGFYFVNFTVTGISP